MWRQVGGRSGSSPAPPAWGPAAMVPPASGLCPLFHPSLPCPSGLCVATPAQLRVFREFHLHLRLPLSVRRFEQLELRPVLYNYLDKNLTVRPCRSLSTKGSGWELGQVKGEEPNWAEALAIPVFLHPGERPCDPSGGAVPGWRGRAGPECTGTCELCPACWLLYGAHGSCCCVPEGGGSRVLGVPCGGCSV